ncbi:hypothetical protein [Streptomyces sp.]|uniref:hypothetical protein n=1 Tax=Streptomyces sp. TaxID=1931 RepID=UPI002F95DAA3
MSSVHASVDIRAGKHDHQPPRVACTGLRPLPYRRMTMHHDKPHPGAVWIAAAHPDPDQVWEEWRSLLAVALIPAGTDWDAVSMRYRRMVAVAETLGPVCDNWVVLSDLRIDRVYVLVPTGTAAQWSEPGTDALSESDWLVVPEPGGTATSRAAWIREPTATTELADPDTLLAALRVIADNGKQP